MKQKQLKQATVTLAKPHTHAGREYSPGEKIALWPDQIERLRELGVIETTTPTHGDIEE